MDKIVQYTDLSMRREDLRYDFANPVTSTSWIGTHEESSQNNVCLVLQTAPLSQLYTSARISANWLPPKNFWKWFLRTCGNKPVAGLSRVGRISFQYLACMGRRKATWNQTSVTVFPKCVGRHCRRQISGTVLHSTMSDWGCLPQFATTIFQQA